MKQKQPGKMRVKALRPYRFLRYVGNNGLAAEVMNSKGKIERSALANLLPYRGEVDADVEQQGTLE